MNTMEIINRTYTFIMNRLVETGRAPHFSETISRPCSFP